MSMIDHTIFTPRLAQIVRKEQFTPRRPSTSFASRTAESWATTRASSWR